MALLANRRRSLWQTVEVDDSGDPAPDPDFELEGPTLAIMQHAR